MVPLGPRPQHHTRLKGAQPTPYETDQFHRMQPWTIKHCIQALSGPKEPSLN